MRVLEMRIFRLAAILCATVIIAACTQKWSVAVERWDASGGPTFCLSTGAQCDERGVQLHFISITEADARGNPAKMVWQIQNMTDKTGEATLKRLTYGQVPQGWKELNRAGDLLPNVYYSVNEEYYFIRDGGYKYSIVAREAYFSGLRAASGPK
jgi:hypothetical protein